MCWIVTTGGRTRKSICGKKSGEHSEEDAHRVDAAIAFALERLTLWGLPEL
jgi:hypothetical protein